MVLARVPFLLEGPRLIFFCSAETRENLVWTDEEHRRIPGQPLNALVGVAVGVGCETAAAAVAARGPLLGDDPEGYIEDGHGDSEPRNHLKVDKRLSFRHPAKLNEAYVCSLSPTSSIHPLLISPQGRLGGDLPPTYVNWINTDREV